MFSVFSSAHSHGVKIWFSNGILKLSNFTNLFMVPPTNKKELCFLCWWYQFQSCGVTNHLKSDKKKNNNTIAKILKFDTSGSFSFCCAKCEEGGVHQSPCPPMLSAYLLPKFIWLSVLLDLYIKQETFKYTWIRVYFTWSNLIHFFVWKKGKVKKLLSSRPILNHLIT